MTAVFFCEDESAMKARQTVFFAYKSPEASSSSETERERERERDSDAMPSNLGKICDKKLALGRCNA